MKITLSLEGAHALQELSDRLKAKHDYSGRGASQLVSQILIEFNAHSNAETDSRVAENVLSPAAKRRALIRKIVAAAGSADMGALERSVRRLNSSTNRLEDQNSPDAGAGGNEDGKV